MISNLPRIAAYTIVETIEKYFTSHFKMSFDAAALNMRKPKQIAKKKCREDGQGQSENFLGRIWDQAYKINVMRAWRNW